MQIKNSYKNGLLACVLTSIASFANADFVVVVSAKNSLSNLTSDQVSDIFLGKVSNFPAGGAALPVDLVEGAPLRDEFYSKVMSKTPTQVKVYWSKMVFTGKGQPPKEVSDSTTVKKMVAENPNAIGYIDKSAVDSSVKVVFSQ